MSKEDIADIPATVPRKRRQLRDAPDLWLAVWAASEDLSRGDRARVEAERSERKQRTPDRLVGILVEREGVTRQQLAGFEQALGRAGATGIVQTYLPGPVHRLCRLQEVAITIVVEQREVVRLSQLVIAAPRSKDPLASGVAELVRYAKHRSTPTIVIPPDWRG